MPRKSSTVLKVRPPVKEPKTRLQTLEEKLKDAKREHAKAVKAYDAAALRKLKTKENVLDLQAKLEKRRG